MGTSSSSSPSATPRPGRIFFERDNAGWNNVRITFESLVCVARVLGRELVLPPPSQIDHLSTPFHETLVYDVPSLRRAVPVVLAGSAPEGSPFSATLSELLDMNAQGGQALPLDLLLQNDRTRLNHFELLFEGRPEARLAAETVLALEIAAPYHETALGALARANLKPGEYHAVHLRRGDFAHTRPDTQWTGSTAASYCKEAFPSEEAHWPLLVACVSGEDNDPFAELATELGSDRRVIRTDALCSPATDGPLLAVLLDTLLLANAGRFCGTPSSTFSTGIAHWRAVAAAKAGKPSPFPCSLGPSSEGSSSRISWERSTTFSALRE